YLAERRNIAQTIYLVERICGLCSQAHTLTFVQAIEEIAQIQPPVKADMIRVVCAELERIHSHMLLIGVVAYDIGLDTLFMYAFKSRETVMDLLEKISGKRVHHDLNTIGGVRFDIDKKLSEQVIKGLKKIVKNNTYILQVLADATVENRLKGVGLLPKNLAAELSVVGPTARGSGLTKDVRFNRPYSAYKDYNKYFKMITLDGCDSLARLYIRVKEVYESIYLIERLLDELPAGPIKVEEKTLKIIKKIPKGEAFSLVEAPRGQLTHYAKTDGKEGLDRLSVRTPTIPNITSVKHMLIHHQIADIPVIFSSIDPCISCANRVTVTDASTSKTKVIQFKNIRGG
ncbi:MAG: nickel-dependent hydrogenase large subunit, partial [Candidatus Odinarchaeota archaeon]